MGSLLDRFILDKILNNNQARDKHIENFLHWCVQVFGKNNFYLETQPAFEDNLEQWTVNNYILELSKKYDIPYIMTSDSHYISKDKLKLHSSFLNSDDNEDEREVEKFYGTAYLMREEEIRDYFKPFWTDEQINIAIQNTVKIGERAERFTFNKKQVIPKIQFENGWESKLDKELFPKEYEYIQKTLNSEYQDDRYLMYLIQKGLQVLISEEHLERTFIRLEEELYQFWKVSESLGDRLHSYFITVAKLVSIMWNEGDSIVGVGRGSCASSIICYLLEITQIDPLGMPVDMLFYRFIDEARIELADVDLDTQSNRRQQIFNAIKEYFSQLNGDVINCCTYNTLSSKAAVLTAARGLGIDVDEAQMISNMILVERGFNWPLKDMYYGNDKEGRLSITEFVNAINKHDQLLETALMIENTIINRGVHAAGVFVINDDLTNYNAIMKSPKMVRTSQFELHDSEQFGLIKFDLLTTKALTKIRQTLDFCIAGNYIKPEPTLKETYYKYLHPMKIQYDTDKTWELIGNNEIIDLFQFDTNVAISALNSIKPKSLVELSQANSLMRLQQQPDSKESPIERFVKFKIDINEAYKEMDNYGVPKEDQKLLEKVLLPYKFVADTQEAIMALVRIVELTKFTVAEAHELRKAVGKKSEKVYNETRVKFYTKGEEYKINSNTLKYMWEGQVKTQKGYAFSILHCISYTFIALQEVYLYQTYPSIYWNCACLTVNAGSDDEYGDTKKSTNYGKIASAIGNMQHKGIKVDLPHINHAKFGFIPDVENNRIIFGIKGINGVGDEAASAIVQNQPYSSFNDFLTKMSQYKDESEENKFGDKTIITLIKAGAFDELTGIDRVDLMKQYINMISEPIKELKMDHILILNDLGLLTPNQQQYELRLYKFRKYLYDNQFLVKQTGKSDSTKYYKLDQKFAQPFFFQHFESNMKEGKDYEYLDNDIIVKKGSLDREYKKLVEPFRKTVLSNDEYLNILNQNRFQEKWDEKASGSISKWEMDSLSFYYHEHELANINKDKYCVTDFEDLPETPEVVEYYTYRGQERPRFKLSRICGTVLDRDKNKHIVTVLTTSGVVNVKFYKGQFGFYNKQISAVLEGDTKKTVLEKSFFARGTRLCITGMRVQDRFIAKKYTDSAYSHSVQLIKEVLDNGDLILQSERIDVNNLELAED